MFVFLHGLIGSPRHFDAVVADMPGDVPLFVPELRYMDLPFDEVGRGVARHIRERASPRHPVVVVGNSIGCVLALDLAEMADHIILTGPPFDFDGAAVPLRRNRLEPFVRSLFAADLDPRVVAAHLEDAVARLDQLTGRRDMLRKTRDLRDISQGFAHHPGFGCGQARITVLAGALDFMAPLEPLRAHMAEVAPHAELRVVPNCGHAVPVEAPEALLEVLRAVVRVPEPPPHSLGSELWA